MQQRMQQQMQQRVRQRVRGLQSIAWYQPMPARQAAR
jgi:hypothetical protein